MKKLTMILENNGYQTKWEFNMDAIDSQQLPQIYEFMDRELKESA